MWTNYIGMFLKITKNCILLMLIVVLITVDNNELVFKEAAWQM